MKRFSGLVAATAVALVPAAALAQGYGAPPPNGQQNGGLQAGGLAPPPPMRQDQNPGSQQTEQQLEKAEQEDSGRGLEFLWLNGEVGYEHLGLQTFKANNLVDAGIVKTTQNGLVYGGGIGARLVFITLGARFRLANFSEFQMWTLDGELGLRIPLGDLEPYFTFAGGYASMGSFDSANIGQDFNKAGVSITGYNLRAGFGLDYYLSPAFSLGANLTGEMLVLSRPGVDPSKLQSSGASASTQDIYKADGSSIGAAATLTAVAGLHF
jgi:hypothetical protein